MQDEFLRLQDLLHKTIIFITHDFDEAIKLADRIAIMKDGLIIQIGSPEELVINPATDYVKEFTKDIPRSKVLTAKSIMENTHNETNGYIEVNENTIVDTFASKLVDNNTNALVLKNSKKPVGIIQKDKIINVLMNKD